MIQASDLHLRDDKPKARTDDYWTTQEKKFRFILDLARKSPPLVVGGDFFHRAKPSLFLVNWTISLLYEYDVIPLIIPGQHDLPTHSLERIPESALWTLQVSGRADVVQTPFSYCGFWNDYNVYGCPYGRVPMSPPTKSNILVWHHLVIKKGEELWPGQEATIAGKLLRQYKEFDIILTGDNHKTFTETSGKRTLVNPGSMMRMTVDQKDHKPCVFELQCDGSLTQHFLPIENEVLDDSHITEKTERDERLESFIKHLQTDYEIGVSFDKNLESFFNINKVKEPVKQLIQESLIE